MLRSATVYIATMHQRVRLSDLWRQSLEGLQELRPFAPFFLTNNNNNNNTAPSSAHPPKPTALQQLTYVTGMQQRQQSQPKRILTGGGLRRDQQSRAPWIFAANSPSHVQLSDPRYFDQRARYARAQHLLYNGRDLYRPDAGQRRDQPREGTLRDVSNVVIRN